MEISPAKLTLIVVASIIVGIAIAIVGGFLWMYSMFATNSRVTFGSDAKRQSVATTGQVFQYHIFV